MSSSNTMVGETDTITVLVDKVIDTVNSTRVNFEGGLKGISLGPCVLNCHTVQSHIDELDIAGEVEIEVESKIVNNEAFAVK